MTSGISLPSSEVLPQGEQRHSHRKSRLLSLVANTRRPHWKPLTAYRYSGGVSAASGRFLTTAGTVAQISSPAAANIAPRLPVGATAETLNTFTIPAGTRIFVGGVKGGADTATQIFIENPSVLIPH